MLVFLFSKSTHRAVVLGDLIKGKESPSELAKVELSEALLPLKGMNIERIYYHRLNVLPIRSITGVEEI